MDKFDFQVNILFLAIILQCYKTIVSRLEKKAYENRSVLKVNIFIYFKHQNAKFKLQVKILLLLEFSTVSLSF